jgi:hypothetical protein
MSGWRVTPLRILRPFSSTRMRNHDQAQMPEFRNQLKLEVQMHGIIPVLVPDGEQGLGYYAVAECPSNLSPLPNSS